MARKAAKSDDARARAAKKLTGRDKLGMAGQALSTTGGAALGAGAACTVAAATGASTLLGSTTLASALGGVFVVTTPVGWVVGGVAAGAAIGYGLSKIVRSGGRQDRIREELRAKLEATTDRPMALDQELATALDEHLANQVISAETAERIRTSVVNGKLAPSVALARLNALPKPD